MWDIIYINFTRHYVLRKSLIFHETFFSRLSVFIQSEWLWCTWDILLGNFRLLGAIDGVGRRDWRKTYFVIDGSEFEGPCNQRQQRQRQRNRIWSLVLSGGALYLDPRCYRCVLERNSNRFLGVNVSDRKLVW